jgi:hypothetical protein
MLIVLPLCAAYALWCLLTMPAQPIMTPDSQHYLNASAIVPLGYPLFLNLVGVRGAMFLQPILFSAALAVLGRETIHATRSTWLAVAVAAGAMLVPQVKDFHASILTESLFMSAVIGFLALMIRFVEQPSWHLMVWVATVVGASATIRRTGFAFVPVLLLMVLLQRHRLSTSRTAFFLVAAAAPFVCIIATEQFAAGVVHAGRTSSLMGRHLFAKAALLEAPPSPPAANPLEAGLERHLDEDYAPIRALLRRAPRDVRAVLAINYESCLQGLCADRSRHLMSDRAEPEQTAIMGGVALRRILRAPLEFARLTALHYQSLWTVERLRHPDTAPALTQFIASHRPLPFEGDTFRATPDYVIAFTGDARVRYEQWGIFALAILTAALAMAGLIAAIARLPLPPAMTIASLAALAAHGGLIFTALLAVGFARFMIGLWPAITTAALFGLWAVYDLATKSTKITKHN